MPFCLPYRHILTSWSSVLFYPCYCWNRNYWHTVVQYLIRKLVVASRKKLAVPETSADVRHLSEAIQIKPSPLETLLILDTALFTQFRSFMESSYPIIHQKTGQADFNQFSYVYTWKGKDTSLQTYVLMAHMDVVLVEAVAESKWTHPSFSWWCLILKTPSRAFDKLLLSLCHGNTKGICFPEVLWKFMLFKRNHQSRCVLWSMMRNFLERVGTFSNGSGKKYPPFSKLSIDEVPEYIWTFWAGETSGGRNRNRRKGACKHWPYQRFLKWGHSFHAPSRNSNRYILNLIRLKSERIRCPHWSRPPFRDRSWTEQGPAEPFMNRMALSNLWLFKGMLVKEMEKTKESNAMIHTTIVPTYL